MSQVKKRPAKKIIYQKKRQNRLSMILSLMVVAAIILAVSVRSVSLRKKLAEYNQNKEQLQEQIAAEEKRSEQIDQYADYVQTDQYVEEVAHDKLGLVKEGEIVFRKDGGSSDPGTAETSGVEDSGSTDADSSTQQDLSGQDTEIQTQDETQEESPQDEVQDEEQQEASQNSEVTGN